jgi:hypothetical protein
VVRVDHPRDVGSRWLESELSAWRLALLSVVPGWVVTYEEGALRVTAGGGT